MMNCATAGSRGAGLGSWVTYGLGTENRNLPGSSSCAPAATLSSPPRLALRVPPGVYQGTYLDTNNTQRTSSSPTFATPNSPRAAARSTRSGEGANDKHARAIAARRSARSANQHLRIAFACRRKPQRFSISRRNEGDSRPATAPRCTPATAAGAAAHREGRACGAGLERRRPAVGQPRQSEAKPPEARRPVGRPIAAFLTI